MTKEYIYLVTDEIQLTPICEDCGPNLVPVMRKEELIRCKDCIHRTRQFGKDHYCRIVSNVMPDNGYCSMAERSSDVRNQDA